MRAIALRPFAVVMTLAAFAFVFAILLGVV
jgi:hypothetical protein